jgi:hypothetical protein
MLDKKMLQLLELAKERFTDEEVKIIIGVE